MGNRGSKSDNFSVKEQRVDGSSITATKYSRVNGKVYSSRRESRFLGELSNPRLKFPLNCPILYKLNNKTNLLWYEFKILQ